MARVTSSLLLLFICTSVTDVSSFALTVEPSHVHVRQRDNVTIMCSNPAEQFTDCQFTWCDVYDENEGPRFKFTQGHNSASAYLNRDSSDSANGALINYSLAGYQYHGDGLEHGQCGIQLFGVMLKYRLMSCRVRSRDSGWVYGTMSVCAEDRHPIELNISSTEPVVLHGDSGTILVKTANGGPLSSCNFRFQAMDLIRFERRSGLVHTAGGQRNPLHRNGQTRGVGDHAVRIANPSSSSPSSGPNNSWAYVGSGLQRGQCGVVLNNVTEMHNGWVYFEAETPRGDFESRVFHLTVARPPSYIVFTVSDNNLIEGQEYSATCTVSESRPVANITWFMGDTIIRRDNLDDSLDGNEPDSAWRWKHDQHILVQTVTRMARREDNGKMLRCFVEHVAMQKPLYEDKRITVHYEQYNPSPTQRSTPVYRPTATVQPSTPVPQYRPTTVNRPGNTAGRVLCPTLTSGSGLTYSCLLRRRLVNCSHEMGAGAVVTVYLECNHRNPGRDRRNRTLTCLESGAWDKAGPTCQSVQPPTPVPQYRPTTVNRPGSTVAAPPVASCGQSQRADGRKLIVSGGPVTYGEFPWHVAVYQLKDQGYEQVCSGSLITMTTVVTAASCFENITSYRYRNFNSSLFKVAAGKHHRDASFQDEHEQWRAVEGVKVRDRYTGQDTYFQSNVALLTVSTAFDNTAYVNPVCVDWRRDRDRPKLQSGQIGFVPGWAFVEEDSPGPILRSVALPYIDYRVCHDSLRPNVKRLVGGDKFCAGSTDEYHGYTVCESDYGAGLVVHNNDTGLYDLQGVANVALKPETSKEVCYSSQIVAFTQFSMFTNWIQETLHPGTGRPGDDF